MKLNTLASLAIGVTVLFSAFDAMAQTFDSSSDVTSAHNNDGTFVIHAGEGPIKLTKTLVPLDSPSTLQCVSSRGCILVFSASVDTNGTALGICAYVDGKQAIPKCSVKEEMGSAFRGSKNVALVAQGNHSVQTKILNESGSEGGVADHWETDYTVYQR
jgi:hypothetical protein